MLQKYLDNNFPPRVCIRNQLPITESTCSKNRIEEYLQFLTQHVPVSKTNISFNTGWHLGLLQVKSTFVPGGVELKNEAVISRIRGYCR